MPLLLARRRPRPHALPYVTHMASYSDGAIKVWNTATHELVVTFAGHKTEVTALSFNRDATMLVSGAKDSDIIVWCALGSNSIIFYLRFGQ